MEGNRFKEIADKLLLLGYILGSISSGLIGLGSVLRMASNLPETPINGSTHGGATNTNSERAKSYFL